MPSLIQYTQKFIGVPYFHILELNFFQVYFYLKK